jgi:hypothetical protein
MLLLKVQNHDRVVTKETIQLGKTMAQGHFWGMRSYLRNSVFLDLI